MKKLFYLLVLQLFLVNVFADNLVFVKKIVPKQPLENWKFTVTKDRVYVMSSESCIYCLDFNGEIKSSIGRRGEGPGEFKSLGDFVILDHHIAAADHSRKIGFFKLDGTLLREKKTEHNIENVFISGKRILYAAKKMDKRDTRNIKFYLKIFAAERGSELFSVPDESRINAVHPATGQKHVLPWYPAPFYNRMCAVTGRDKKLRLFFVRENFFYEFADGEFKKIDFKFVLKAEAVEKKDRQQFLDQVDRGTGRKFPARTKKSVIFPAVKELFLGAISWDDGFALVCKSQLIIISKDGKFIKKIAFPSAVGIYDRSVGYPENSMVKDGDFFYIKNEEEEIAVFKIIS